MTTPISGPLGPLGAKAIEGRGISPETAVRYGIHTVRRTAEGTVVPDPNGNIVAFPFMERGAVVAEKYRAPGKKFWQRAGGRRTFWNADALDDPALLTGAMPLIVTEGEIDALTAIECGFPLTVSVPDGAPAVGDGEKPDEIPELDPEHDKKGKFQFFFNNRERIQAIKRFIIAVDNDPPGQRLAAELVRRFQAGRCAFVEYPEGCKDLNDVLVQHGPEAVAQVLNTAKPYPLRGLYRLSDYPDLPPIPTFKTGWPTLDEYFRPYAGAFAVITGIPGHGKSTWAMNLLYNLYRSNGLRSAVFSPEMPTVPHLRDKLRRIVSNKALMALDVTLQRQVDAVINDAFVFIGADPTTGYSDEDFSLGWIIERAVDAVLRDGINCLLIDPWNEVEHAKAPNENMTDYIGRSIRALRQFARAYEVLTIVVAHPTKEVGREGKARSPTLYDIEGSAHWFNKPDFGIVVHRDNPDTDETLIRLAKVRFDDTGRRGEVRLRFDPHSSRYEMLAGF